MEAAALRKFSPNVIKSQVTKGDVDDIFAEKKCGLKVQAWCCITKIKPGSRDET